MPHRLGRMLRTSTKEQTGFVEQRAISYSKIQNTLEMHHRHEQAIIAMHGHDIRGADLDVDERASERETWTEHCVKGVKLEGSWWGFNDGPEEQTARRGLLMCPRRHARGNAKTVGLQKSQWRLRDSGQRDGGILDLLPMVLANGPLDWYMQMRKVPKSVMLVHDSQSVMMLVATLACSPSQSRALQ